MNVFDLFAKLTLDTSEYESGLNNARGSAEKGGSKIGAALGNVGKMAGAALAAATTAAVGFGAASVATGAEFDKSMSQVAATMGYTVDELNDSTSEASQNFNRLRDFAQEMGSSTAFSASQAADALNYMALAGYDTEKSISMLPSVLDLAASGNMDLARASDMVTDTQSALNLSTEETSTLIDQMAKTASSSNTSVEQLGDAMLTIGATARDVSGGTTELNSVLGVLADNGIKGSEAGTHLRNILLKMNPDTKAAAEAWDQLGVEAYDAEGNLRPLPDIFQELNKAMDGFTTQDRQKILSDMFKETDLASVNALLGTQAERWTELGAKIDDASGAAKNMAETQLDNLAGDVTKFSSALEGAKIMLSDQLTPTLRNFVQFGTEGVSTLTDAFKENGLQGVFDALPGVIEKGVDMIFEMLPKFVDAGLALLEGLIKGIVNNLPKLVDAAIKIITTLVENISDNIDQLIDAALAIITALADGLIEALPKLIPVIVKIVTTLVEKFTEPDTLFKLSEAAFKIQAALAEGLIKAIPELLKSVPVIIKNLLEVIINYVPQMVKGGEELIKGIASGFASAAGELVNSAKQLIEKVKDAFKDLINKARQWGVDMIQNLIEGIKSKVSGVVNAVSGIASKVKSFLGFSEPEEGPLSDFHTYAPDMMKLFAQGIRDNTKLVTDQIRSSFDFGNFATAGVPSLAGGSGSTTNTYNITVNGIEELEELLNWYQSRQVRARMA